MNEIILEINDSIIVNEITDSIITESAPVIFTVNSNNIQKDYIAGESILSYKFVVLINDKIYLADKDNINHLNKVTGLALQSGDADDTISVLLHGTANLNLWNLTLNSNYFIDNNGEISPTKPTTGFLQIIGYAQTIDKLFVRITEPIILI